ncbi:MAG: hypothetical protein E4H26_00425 [Flavobacteriales bacterium]|nr:MAG: hypothetical protein E4H26_00425 [Flavobacteriales bacterium]
MRYVILIIVIVSFTAIIYGLNLDDEQADLANRCIGTGTVGIFLVAMPLFLVTESKGKKMKDYMLTEENIRKMQDKPQKNKDKQ